MRLTTGQTLQKNNKFKDTAIKTIKMKHRGGKPNNSELQDNFKQPSTYVIQVPKRKKGEVTEEIFENNGQNFSNWMKIVSPQIQEAQ